MLTLTWAFLLGCFLLIVAACGRGPRLPGVSWFAILPYLPESKKAKGRMQQKRKKRR